MGAAPSPSTAELTELPAREYRERQELRSRSLRTNVTNRAQWVHGTVVTNRRERRAAEAVARRYGCETKEGGEHGERCPKREVPRREQRSAEPVAAADSVSARREEP